MISSEYLRSLHEYICNLCETKGVSIDLRWRCFGDLNKFYINNKFFSISCDFYYTTSLEGIRKIFDTYITCLCEHFMYPSNNRIALYVENILYEDGLYKVIIGACTFKDDSIT